MIDRARIATRQYAKRQYTWFAHQPPDGWPRAETQLDDDMAHDLARKLRNDALTR
jgi:tRNA dimethylallyltransferase